VEAAAASVEDAAGTATGSAEADAAAVDAASTTEDGPSPEDDATDDGAVADEADEGPVDDAADEGPVDDAADEGSVDDAAEPAVPETLPGHVREVVGSGRVRLLDDAFAVRTEADAVDAFDAVLDAEEVPYAVVLDGELEQRLLDVAAQRGVEHVVAGSLGEFVKRPVGVRVRTTDQFAA
jgi:hypothetical protein